MTKRVITGAILIVAVTLAIYFQGWVLQACLLAAMALSTYEMFGAFKAKGIRPVQWPAYAFCLFSVLNLSHDAQAISLHFGPEALIFCLAGCMLAAMSVIVLRGRVDFDALTASVFPMFYPGLLYVCILKLANLESRMDATLALALTFFVPSMNDCFALLTGLTLGRHKLSPEISPKKTVEGAVGGLAASVFFALLLPVVARLLVEHVPGLHAHAHTALPPLWMFALLGLVMGALGQFGDLAASLVKRHCGIKDFGKIFPGHGGVMDRMDGILFSSVATLIFFHLKGIYP